MLECVFAKFVFPCGIYIGGCISTNELIFFSFRESYTCEHGICLEFTSSNNNNT